MQLLSVLPDVLTLVVSLTDQVPEDEDVKAGWVAFAVFIGLILAVALLGWSLTKQLRKAQAAEEAGVYAPSKRTLREQARAEAEQAQHQQVEQSTQEPGPDDRPGPTA